MHAGATPTSVSATALPELARHSWPEAIAVGTRSSNQNAGPQSPADGRPLDTVFYTPPVVNAPKCIEAEIKHSRDILRDFAKRPIRYEREEKLDAIRHRDEEYRAEVLYSHHWLTEPIPELHPTCAAISMD
jgi:hypothetical protein